VAPSDIQGRRSTVKKIIGKPCAGIRMHGIERGMGKRIREDTAPLTTNATTVYSVCCARRSSAVTRLRPGCGSAQTGRTGARDASMRNLVDDGASGSHPLRMI
jgi:hypothetical protein